MISRSLSSALLLLVAPAVWAEVPRVATDILPVHGLVSRVMAGVGTPDLVLPPGASPHHHAMRPSEAEALEGADLVFWVGPELTPWLAHPLETLAGDARRVELLETPGTVLLPFREGAPFSGGAEEHEHDHHGGMDPHAWLDPENGRAWLGAIAEALAAADPEHAAAYRANAEAGAAEIAAQAVAIGDELAPMRGRPVALFHDATQYFEARFGLTSLGALSPGDGAAPGPATMAALRARIAEEGVACLLIEPDANAGLSAALLEGTGAEAVTLDPIGRDIAPGPGFYPALLREMADSLDVCG